MNWWFATNGKKHIWIQVDRWFNARAFARSQLGDAVDATKTNPPPASCADDVFIGKWSKHDASPNSNLTFDKVERPKPVAGKK